jgi:hypothetical protein
VPDLGVVQDHGVEPQPGPLHLGGAGPEQGVLQPRLVERLGQGVQGGRVAVVDCAGPGVKVLPVDPFEFARHSRAARAARAT